MTALRAALVVVLLCHAMVLGCVAGVLAWPRTELPSRPHGVSPPVGVPVCSTPCALRLVDPNMAWIPVHGGDK